MRDTKFRFYYKGTILDTLTLKEISNSNYHWAEGVIVVEYTGLKDKNGVESAHFDIANDKYLLYLDLVYGLYLIDISNGAIIRYEEGIIKEITGNYFEQHEKISEDCQRGINKLLSQANRTM